MELGFECRYMFILSIVLYPDVATTFPRGQFHISVSWQFRSGDHSLLPVTTLGYFRSGRKKTPLYMNPLVRLGREIH